ncbi:MAG: glycosyltransferase family 39 protein [Deltaproteobacteria bacterium]|nr:glycosyltransferase family 39 protein [Deltaproteobacteria bacterium]
MSKKTLNNLLPIVIGCLAFGFYLFLILKFDWYINSSDFFPTEFSAILQFTGNPKILTGYYSPGYPLLLNIISIFTRNYLFSAKLLCAISGGLLVYLVYKISFIMFRNILWALLTAFIVGINSHIIFGSIGENQDILVASLLLWTFYLLLKAPGQNKTWFFVGLIIGIASIIKQYSIVFILIYILIIVIEHYGKGTRLYLPIIGYLIGGTILGSLPQLIVNTIVYLNPFYNYTLQSGNIVIMAQNQNIYFPSLKNELSNVFLTFLISIYSNTLPLLLHLVDVFRIYSMCLKLQYYIVAAVILLIFKKPYKKIVLENSIVILGFVVFISMVAYLEKGTYLPVALTSLFYVPAGAVLADIKPKMLFKPLSILLVIYVTMFAPIVEPKTFHPYSHSIVYVDQPRYGTIKDSISEVAFFYIVKKVSKDLSYTLNLHGMISPLDVLSTPGYIYYNNINDPYKLKDAFSVFVDFSQAQHKNDIIKLDKIGIINLKDLRKYKLLNNIRFYMPYYSLGPTQYLFDKDFWVLFPDMWFSNLFELIHVMQEHRIKFVILNKKWVESNLPMFSAIANATSLGKQFDLIFRYHDDYYVYRFKKH